MISERQCIDLIRQFSGSRDKEFLVRGIGDDCAVLKKDDADCLLLTTDTLVEGVHFDLAWHPPHLLGRKSAAVNLSDIAAMGGRPTACLLSIAFPDGVPSWFAEFMAGFSEVLREFDTLLVGGDTVRGRNDIVVTVTLIGEVKKATVCYRSGAQPGDLVWVSGPLGNGAAGLELCRKGLQKSYETATDLQQLVKAHLDPEPLVRLGAVLAASGLVHAMMDISDGLATDLAHLCKESGVGAEVRQDLLPVYEPLRLAAAALGANVLDWVLRGGEDYQLLFTSKAADENKLRRLAAEQSDRKIVAIGKIVEGQGVFLCRENERRDISYQGFDHFRG